MKTTLRSTVMAVISSGILLSFGCEKKTAATNPTSESNPELRQNTKPLQAADLVGYDGMRLRESVDHIIDANEKHDRELQKAIEDGSEQ